MTFKMSLVTTAALCITVALTGCIQLAEERALLDEEVGQGEIDSVAVEIEDGLGVIHRLFPGELTVWASSPGLSIEVVSRDEAPTTWRVRIHNVMSNAALNGTTANGDPVATTPIRDPNEPRTHKTWDVELPSKETVHLAFAPESIDDVVPFRIAMINDTQGPEELANLIPLLEDDPDIKFVISTGDITHMGERAQLERIQRDWAASPVPIYATIGNHEIGGNDNLAWHDTFGRHSSHFTWSGVGFSLVDTSTASIDPLVYDQLSNWIPDGNTRLDLFVSHIPPLDPSGIRSASFRSRYEAGKILALLADRGCDMLLHGHIHTFQFYEQAGIESLLSGGRDHIAVLDIDPASRMVTTYRRLRTGS